MGIDNPAQLVDEFKKSGEFDRLRRELLAQFQQSEGFSSFKSRTDVVVRERLAADQKLRYMPPDTMHRELMQELDRYPIVERAVGDSRMLSDPSFADSIRTSLQKMLSEDKKSATKGTSHAASTSKSDRLESDPHRHATTKAASSKSSENHNHSSLTKTTKAENTEFSMRNTPASRPSSSTTTFESPLTTEGNSPERNLVTSATPSNIMKQTPPEIGRVETPSTNLPDVEMLDEPKK